MCILSGGITLNTKKSNQTINYVVIQIRFTLVKVLNSSLNLKTFITSEEITANGCVYHSDEYLFKH